MSLAVEEELGVTQTDSEPLQETVTALDLGATSQLERSRQSREVNS
jgi:hypothetical protein